MNRWGSRVGAAAALLAIGAGLGSLGGRLEFAQSQTQTTNGDSFVQAPAGQDSVFEERPSIGPTFEPIRKSRPDFFEESQQSLDDEILRFQQERPAPGFNLDSGFMSWQPAIFREGGFSIYVPMGVLTEELETVVTAEGDLEFDVFAVHSSTSRFVVAYANRGDEQAEQDELLDTLRVAVIEATEFEVGVEAETELEGQPGRELQLFDDEESIAVRLILTDDRIYVVGIRQLRSIESAELATTFLDSFNLL
ncbi:MAG: hypothetical protein AAGA40_18740 [Cyanobacteria bacterium P01_E01_bin.45]